MLVEFRVKNYKSFRDETVFSMIAEEPATKKAETSFETGFRIAPDLSNISVIYGPNASGKSNLLDAMNFMIYFVLFSNKGEEHLKSLKRHVFDKESYKSTSEFEFSFIYQNFLFRYGFEIDNEKVHNEWLTAIDKDADKQKVQTWINRKGKTKIGAKVDGSSDTKKTWIETTRDNNLLFSNAVNLNSKKLEIPFQWFKKHFRSFSDISPTYTLNCIENSKEKKMRILKFMKSLDFSFDDIKIIEHEFDEKLISAPKVPDALKNFFIERIKEDGGKVKEVELVYRQGNKNKVSIDLDDESLGTKRLLSFAGPILDVLENGYTLIIDELDSSLHPIALKGVIELFRDKSINSNNAQLIFTTHDTSVMKLFAREQIWLVDKDETLNSELFSVAEFEGRSDEIVERKYLNGRYGALPLVESI